MLVLHICPQTYNGADLDHVLGNQLQVPSFILQSIKDFLIDEYQEKIETLYLSPLCVLLKNKSRLPFEFIDFHSVVLVVDKIVEQTGCAKMFLKALHSSLHAVL